MIGVVLIIASVIAFSVLGGFLRGGTRVYTVTTSIAPGEALTADNVREVSVHVDTAVYAPTSDTPLGSSSCAPTSRRTVRLAPRTRTAWSASPSP